MWTFEDQDVAAMTWCSSITLVSISSWYRVILSSSSCGTKIIVIIANVSHHLLLLPPLAPRSLIKLQSKYDVGVLLLYIVVTLAVINH